METSTSVVYFTLSFLLCWASCLNRELSKHKSFNLTHGSNISRATGRSNFDRESFAGTALNLSGQFEDGVERSRGEFATLQMEQRGVGINNRGRRIRTDKTTTVLDLSKRQRQESSLRDLERYSRLSFSNEAMRSRRARPDKTTIVKNLSEGRRHQSYLRDLEINNKWSSSKESRRRRVTRSGKTTMDKNVSKGRRHQSYLRDLEINNKLSSSKQVMRSRHIRSVESTVVKDLSERSRRESQVIAKTFGPFRRVSGKQVKKPLECGLEVGLNITVDVDAGIVSFRAPCCAVYCSAAVKLIAGEGQMFEIEFLELNLPSPFSINPDGSQSCTGDLVVFYYEHLFFCGNKVPEPFKVNKNSVLISYSGRPRRTATCHEFLSFKLKYRVLVQKEERGDCESQLTVLQEGESGFITSPGYRPGEAYTRNINCHWQIAVSENKVLQLSFELFQVDPGDFIRISAHRLSHMKNTQDINLFFRDGHEHRLNRDYRITLPSSIAFVSYEGFGGGFAKGFKMHYKAVSKDSFVPIIDEFTLSCSAHKHSIPESSLCDFQVDCLGREDETNCSFIDDSLCPGGHVFGTSCYFLVRSQFPLPWEAAEFVCAYHYNGHLITPNSLKEQKFFSNLVDGYYPFTQVWYLGIRQMSFDSDFLYRRLFKGMDGTTIFNGFRQQFKSHNFHSCTVWNYKSFIGQRELQQIRCDGTWTDINEGFKGGHPDMHIACEVRNISKSIESIKSPSHHNWTAKLDTFQCVNSKERILLSRRCDEISDCFDGTDERNCPDLGAPVERFACASGNPLGYAHVCDAINDCPDKSDEEFCLPVPDDDPSVAVCTNGVAVASSSWCDAKPDCLDASDELDCESCNGGSILCPSVGCMPRHWVDDDQMDCPMKDREGQWVIEPDFIDRSVLAQPPPGAVMPDGYGKVTISPLNAGEPCPPTHAQCPNGYCIPVYMLCNGHKDCPDGEDELSETCQSFCKGRYRCHKTSTCLHDEHVCDGWFHCPLHDDEEFCSVTRSCPESCVCTGREMTCATFLPLSNIGCVKRLDVSHATSGNSSFSLHNHCIIALIAKNAGILKVDQLDVVNLYKLDLSDNCLARLEIGVFKKTTGIRQLSLARNALSGADLHAIRSLEKLEVLDMSGNSQERLRSFSFLGCSKLTVLYLDDMGITTVEPEAFAGLSQLEVLSIKGNPISKFQKNIFSALFLLSSLMTDNYKLCCPTLMPKVLSTGTCQAPKDEISSCEDILRTPFFRSFLCLMAVLTVSGNIVVLCYKFFIENKSFLGYNTLITSLSSADLLMGIYLVIIGAADQAYRGRYLWLADVWKNSSYCSLAGVLSTISSEVSAMTICLITLDRYLALAFPLSKLHLTPKSARVIVLITWMVGAMLAGIPFIPPLSHWQFYSQTSVCIPLPITRAKFPGSDYAFAVFIVLNFAMFVSIALGQALIFRSVRANSIRVKGAVAGRRNQEAAIARKLAMVVLTDFLCWFPIGVMGLLAKVGVPIPGEVNVVATIFILPLNSALNPYLYTLPAVRGNLKQREKATLSQRGRTSSSSLGSSGKGRTVGVWRMKKPLVSRRSDGEVKSSAEKGRLDKPEVCLDKLRRWLRTGRVSTARVRDVLSRFESRPSSSQMSHQI